MKSQKINKQKKDQTPKINKRDSTILNREANINLKNQRLNNLNLSQTRKGTKSIKNLNEELVSSDDDDDTSQLSRMSFYIKDQYCPFASKNVQGIQK